jgi:opacity protein-like surface antigen
MKNIILYFFLILFFLTSISFAQYYVKLQGGYNLGLNPRELGENQTYSSGTDTYEIVSGSFGEGVNFTGAFGYDFCSNLGLELELIYKLSTEYEISLEDGNAPYNHNRTWKGSFFAFAPTFVVNAPMNKIKVFAKLGLLIPLPALEIDIAYNDGTSETGVFSGGLDFGLTGGAGVLVPLSSTINFLVEIDFISYSWKPGEIELTYYDGTTETIQLQDEYTSDDENTQGAIFIPFSNVGLNVGVQIGF